MTEVRRYRVNRNQLRPDEGGNVVLVEDYEIEKAFESAAVKSESEAADLIVSKLVSELKEMRDESAWKLTKRLFGRILAMFLPNPNTKCRVCTEEHPKSEMRHVALFAWVCPKKCYDAYVDWATWGSGFDGEGRL